jgi:hypothetical protein
MAKKCHECYKNEYCPESEGPAACPENKSGLLVIPEQHPDKFIDMPPGLNGFWWESKDVICIPDVASLSEGSGNFSRWLRYIELKHKIVFFPTVVSARLEAILRGKGYTEAITEGLDSVFGEVVEGLGKDFRLK